MTEKEVKQIVDLVNPPFFKTFEFWIGNVIGLAGLWFSILAFREARAAKDAAWEAGKTVKIQTITIELTEIAQRLDKPSLELSFSEGRDLLNEVSRRLRRLIASFEDNDELVEKVCANLKLVLDDAKKALDELRPRDQGGEDLPPNTVYFGIESYLSNISNLVAEITGLLEKRIIEVTRK